MIRASNSLLVVGEQTDLSAFPPLDPATQAIIAEGTRIEPQPDTQDTNEDTGSLDRGETRVTGLRERLSTRVYLVGAGAPGQSPRYRDLLRACGWAEQITTATIPAAPEAVGAGSTTTKVVLGASASSQDQIYRGMPLQLGGDMNVLTFVADYDGASKTATVTDTLPSAPASATTTWQILPNVVYRPASSGLPYLGIDVYMDGLRARMDGARGSVDLVFPTRGHPALDFQIDGRHVGEADVAVPTVNVARPVKPVFSGGRILLDRKPLAVSQAQVQMGGEVEMPDDPNEPQGFRAAELTSRRFRISVDPLMDLIANAGDVMADLLAGTETIAHWRCGTLAGNRLAVTAPRAALTAAGRDTRGAFRTRSLQLDARGADAGIFLCIY